MPSDKPNYFELVYQVVNEIPKGRVTSYGAIAHYLGLKSGARMVGYAMNAAHSLPDVPAHRKSARLTDWKVPLCHPYPHGGTATCRWSTSKKRSGAGLFNPLLEPGNRARGLRFFAQQVQTQKHQRTIEDERLKSKGISPKPSLGIGGYQEGERRCKYSNRWHPCILNLMASE